MLEGKTVALIGAGVMAEVIAGGLLRSKLSRPEDLVMSHYRQDRLDELARLGAVRLTRHNNEACSGAEIVVL
ncbi:MAG TPA: NAD(P)-binding domain-containing protein, partial [Chloroflexota bacterium]|nr:NAD(P)-binding domain-containing protein [Chloroflexota bacterium]